MSSWILDAIILIFLVLFFYKTLPAYAAKKGENRADKEDAGRISYEQEHGKNLATKDNIDFDLFDDRFLLLEIMLGIFNAIGFYYKISIV